uniref:Uncharacterized protein n=1 Tax=viral metagenome TaxID=1070528 RepID=A0A6C0KJM4_9ZZZZ
MIIIVIIAHNNIAILLTVVIIYILSLYYIYTDEDLQILRKAKRSLIVQKMPSATRAF